MIQGSGQDVLERKTYWPQVYVPEHAAIMHPSHWLHIEILINT